MKLTDDPRLRLFYPGRAKLVAALEERLMEASRQVAYWTRQFGRHGDEDAWAALDGAMRVHGATMGALHQIHDHPDHYPLASSFPDLSTAA